MTRNRTHHITRYLDVRIVGLTPSWGDVCRGTYRPTTASTLQRIRGHPVRFVKELRTLGGSRYSACGVSHRAPWPFDTLVLEVLRVSQSRSIMEAGTRNK